MQLKTAAALVRAAEERGLAGLTLRPEYSGRAMYGRTTVGIVLARATTLVALAAHVVAGMTTAPSFIASIVRFAPERWPIS